MAIADFVSGKAAEPITVRALVSERSAEAGDVLALAEHHGARMVDLKFTDLRRVTHSLVDQFVVPSDLLFQVQRGRQIRGPCAYEDNIHRDLFAFSHR